MAPLLLPESARAGERRRRKPSPLLSDEGSTSSAAVAFDRIDFEGGEAQLRVEVSARPSYPAMHLNDRAGHVVVAFRNPAKLGAFSMQDGALVANVELCADADDMFMDAKRERVYVSCGDGHLDVFDTRENAYPRINHIATIAGARTSLFVPEFDVLFIAARATPSEPAAIWVFRPNYTNQESLP